MLCTAFAREQGSVETRNRYPASTMFRRRQGRMGKWLRAGCYPPTASRIAWVGHRYGQAASPGGGHRRGNPHHLREQVATAKPHRRGKRVARKVWRLLVDVRQHLNGLVDSGDGDVGLPGEFLERV